ncbi:hypothetical protein SAVIM338S_02081 [Streptomyces avidinii]
MSQPDLFTAALTTVCGAYAVLGTLWWFRDRADRAAVARLDAADIDPYHAAATADRAHGADRAGAAALLLGGLIRIEDDGKAAVTAGGGDPGRTPGHPVPAAVLTTLRERAEPRPLNFLYVDPGHRGRLDPYLRREDARWPRWSTRGGDRVQPAAILTAVLFAGWCAAQLLYAHGAFSGPAGEIAAGVFVGLLVWAAFALVLGVLVLWAWPWRRDRFAEYCRTLPPHPAEAALDAGQLEQLHRAMTFDYPTVRPVEDLSWDPGAF